MRQSFHTLRLLPLSGICSATCEKLLSAVKFNGRKLFALLILFSFAFSLPVSAAKIDPINGVIVLEPDTLGIRRNSLTENTLYGFQSVPETFEFSDDTYRFTWQSLTAYTGFYSTVTESGKELSFIINFGDGVGDCIVSWESLIAKPLFRAVMSDDRSELIDFTWTGDYDMYVDGSLVYHRDLEDDVIPPIINWEGSVSRYIEIRITSLMDSINVVDIEDASIINQYVAISTNGLTVNDESVIIEDISVSVKNIESDIGDIKDSVGNIENDLSDLNDTADSINTTVTNIDNGVAKIEGTVTDMSEQLQSPDSNIWQAGGTTIKNAVTELFVPPEDELKAQQEQLELKMADKIGPVMEFSQTAKNNVDGILDLWDSADSSYKFHFPGIIVNLPNIGEFVIVSEQDVSISNRLISVFQDALAYVVAFLCMFSLCHLTEDMIYCLFSGVSYWGFIRSRHDK